MTFGFSFGSGGGSGSSAFPTTPTILVNGKKRDRAKVGDALTVAYPSVGLTAPTQQARRNTTAISGATGYLYTTVAADAETSLTFTGTDLAGAAYTTAAVTVAAIVIAVTINSAVFNAGGAGVPASIATDFDYNGAGTLTATFAFRDGGGTVLDTLTVTPFTAGTTDIDGLDAAAEGATDVVITISDGTVSGSVTRAVSGIDATAPYVSTFSPADAATDVPSAGNLVVTFAEPIFKGAGSITIGGGVSVTIANCTVSGSTLTIPYSGLPASTALTPTWPAGFVKDAQGNPVGALTNEWSFTTAAAAGIVVALIGTPQANTTVASTHNYNFDSTGYDKLIVTAGRNAIPTSVTVEGVSLTPIGTSGGDTSSGGYNQGYLRTVATQGAETATVQFAAAFNANSFIPVGLNNGTVTSASYVTSNNSTVSKSVTPTSATNKILALFVGSGANTFVPPTGMTEILAPVIINGSRFAAYTFDNAPNGSPYSVSFSSDGRVGLALFAISGA